jgi:hypothetical protein
VTARRPHDQYLDPVAFTALFRARRKHHAQICLGLRAITLGVARTFAFDDVEQRRDCESEALLFALCRIDRFRFDAGRDAFAYYTSVARNAIRRQLAKARRLRGRSRLFSELRAVADRGAVSERRLLLTAKPYALAV